MDQVFIAYLAGGLVMAFAASATALSIAWLASRAMDGIARQPEASNNIRLSMILAIAFIEAIALYALVVSLILITKS